MTRYKTELGLAKFGGSKREEELEIEKVNNLFMTTVKVLGVVAVLNSILTAYAFAF